MTPERINRVISAMQTLMRGNSVSRSLESIRRYHIEPERIDETILAAINANLCLISGGDDHVADGFNDDVARNGRDFMPRHRLN